MSKRVFIPIISVLIALVFLLSPIAPVQNFTIPNSDLSVGQILHPPGNPFAHSFSDVKDIRTATIVVAAYNSENRYDANYHCDHTADDVQIQAALTAGAGGEVVLLEGDYSTIATLTVPANTTLSGMGNGTVITPTGAAITTHAIIINGSNVTLRDFKVILAAGCGIAANHPNIIYADTQDNIICERLWLVGDITVGEDVFDTHQNGIYYHTVTDSTIIDCISENNGKSGFTVITSCEDCIIANNISKSNLNNGFDISTNLRVTVVGNKAIGNGLWGITCGTTTDSSYVGNIAEENTEHGIYIAFTSVRNTFSGNTVRKNDFSGNTYSGIYISTSCDENDITGNVCTENGLHGIMLRRTAYCNVTGNVCNSQFTGDGIHLLGTGAGVNTVEYNNVSGNICANNAGYGIQVVGGAFANDNQIKDNLLHNNTTGEFADAGTNTTTRNNYGWVTENSGTATLANGNTTIVVAHGLDVTPTQGDIVVTPIEHWGNMTFFYIDTFGAANFTITSDQDPGQDVDFAWKAIVL